MIQYWLYLEATSRLFGPKIHILIGVYLGISKKSLEVARKYPGGYKVLTNYTISHGKIVNSQRLKIDSLATIR